MSQAEITERIEEILEELNVLRQEEPCPYWPQAEKDRDIERLGDELNTLIGMTR